MNPTYVHGYTPREAQRLLDQAGTLAELLHHDTGYPAGHRGPTFVSGRRSHLSCLYAVEDAARALSPEARAACRQAEAAPVLAQLHDWCLATLARLPPKSELAGAIRYATTRWPALTRYLEDGRLAIDNNLAERALRAIALGRKNFLFAGSDTGGERAAIAYSVIASAKANGHEPFAYLRDVLARLPTTLARDLHTLLPWNWRQPATD
jgi:hypothetical protein